MEVIDELIDVKQTNKKTTVPDAIEGPPPEPKPEKKAKKTQAIA